MKVREAIEVLMRMNPDSEVNLSFDEYKRNKYIDPHDPDGGVDPMDEYNRQKTPARNWRC